MIELWGILLPLAIGSAILPMQIAITVVLTRGAGGRRTAAAWIAGLTVVRLAQGVVVGLVLGPAVEATDTGDGPGPILATLLLVVAVAFYAVAIAKLVRQPDEDATPPAWMSMVASLRPARAFALGVGVVAASAKLWAFTLAAIGSIEEAALGLPVSIATYLVFVVAAESIHLAILGIAVLAPTRADAILGGLSASLERYSRPIAVALGIGFGTWFLIKALTAFAAMS